MSFDEAATIPLPLQTAALALYSFRKRPTGRGAGLTPPWEAGGRGKYTGQPILIFAGSAAVSQYGTRCPQIDTSHD